MECRVSSDAKIFIVRRQQRFGGTELHLCIRSTVRYLSCYVPEDYYYSTNREKS